MEFQLLIKSNSKISTSNSNNCVININNNKTIGINKLECEVFAFSISFPVDELPQASYITLESDNLNITDQITSDNRKPLISLYDVRNQRFSRTVFNVSNFSGNINFKLLDETGELLKDNEGQPYNLHWLLLLKCKVLD